MEINEPVLMMLVMLFALGFSLAAAYNWRRAALLWRDEAKKLAAFINDPNVKQRDKEVEYKNTYEARVNALDDERRVIHESVMDVFEVLNDIQADSTPQFAVLQQCRNVLLRAIQTSTYGRE